MINLYYVIKKRNKYYLNILNQLYNLLIKFNNTSIELRQAKRELQ